MNAVALATGRISRHALLEKRARFFQLELWNRRLELWPRKSPEHPLQVLEPGVGIQSLGFELRNEATLAPYSESGKNFQTAGVVDQDSKTVMISGAFPYVQQRYTLSHELAHLLLHPRLERLHRDRPIDHPEFRKDEVEREADLFASYFLLPAKWVIQAFEASFGRGQFVLDQHTAFALCSTGLEDVLARCRSRRDLSLMLARAVKYNSRPIQPLAARFEVSPTAMAIRLEGLGLIADVTNLLPRRY
jgi:Zn-dependent peptidase ImmA (M78 family)